MSIVDLILLSVRPMHLSLYCTISWTIHVKYPHFSFFKKTLIFSCSWRYSLPLQEKIEESVIDLQEIIQGQQEGKLGEGFLVEVHAAQPRQVNLIYFFLLNLHEYCSCGYIGDWPVQQCKLIFKISLYRECCTID